MDARWSAVVIALAGCGRIEFAEHAPSDGTVTAGDAPIDAAPNDAAGSALGIFADSCALLLRMDEPAWTGATGEVIDSCGGNNGTAIGGISTVPNGTRGRAGLFSAAGCVEIGDAPNLRPTNALTMSAWLNSMGDPTNSFGVIAKRIDYLVDSAYTMYLWTANQMYTDINTEDDRFGDTAATIVNGTWTQVTIVYDGTLAEDSRVVFYIDGVKSFTGAESAASITQFTSPLDIGCLQESAPSQEFIGELDDVGIWTRAFSDAEVMTWYTETHP